MVQVLAWLLCKVDQARAALTQQLAGMEESSQLSYVLGFMSEYLSDRWLTALCAHLGAEPSGVGSSNTAGTARTAHGALGSSGTANAAADGSDAAKRSKVMDPKEAAKEAARKKAAETKAANMAKLAAGTKKINSFFVTKAAVPR